MAADLELLRQHVAKQLRDDGERALWLDRIMPATQTPFQLPNHGIGGTLLDMTLERNQKLLRLVDKHLSLPPSVEEDPVQPGELVIREVTWSYLFCYGKGNRFRLHDKPLGMVWLHGGNGVGKTAFQEVLVMALYGSGIPSRAGSGDPRDYVNCRCPDGEHPEAAVEIMSKQRLYRVRRTWGAVSSSCSVVDVTDQHAHITVAKTSAAVNKWLVQHVGTKDQFLRSVALTQGNDCGFFDLDGVKQLELLMDDVQDDQVAHPSLSAGCLDVTKAYAVSAAALLRCAMTAEDACRPAAVSCDVQAMRAQRASLEAEIEQERLAIRDLRDEWNPAVRALGLRDPPSSVTVHNMLRDLRRMLQHAQDKLDRAKADVEQMPQLDEQQRNVVADLRRRLADLEARHPFNPQCAACRAQPWRAKAQVLRKDLDAVCANAKSGGGQPPIASIESELETLREQLVKWEGVEQLLPQCDVYVTRCNKLQALKKAEADLSLSIEMEKARREAEEKRATLQRVVDELGALHEVANKARLILAGYRCWVLEHHILPQFLSHMNAVLRCFPSGRVPAVSISKLQVSPDVTELFLPCWRLGDGRISLARSGGFHRALVNCAARISLGRMHRNTTHVRCSLLLIDELLAGGDHDNRQHIPEFLQTLVERFGYQHLVYSCHVFPASAGSPSVATIAGHDEADAVLFF